MYYAFSAICKFLKIKNLVLNIYRGVAGSVRGGQDKNIYTIGFKHVL